MKTKHVHFYVNGDCKTWTRRAASITFQDEALRSVTVRSGLKRTFRCSFFECLCYQMSDLWVLQPCRRERTPQRCRAQPAPPAAQQTRPRPGPEMATLRIQIRDFFNSMEFHRFHKSYRCLSTIINLSFLHNISEWRGTSFFSVTQRSDHKWYSRPCSHG